MATLSGIDSLETLSRRSAVQSLCDFAGDPCLLNSLTPSELYLEVTSNGGVSSLPTANGAACSAAALSIDSQLAWVLEAANVTPGGPVWKFLRELENVQAKCETALPQQRRLEFILASDITYEGRQRLLYPLQRHRKNLEHAENSVFRSSVLKAVMADFSEDDDHSLGLSAPEYTTASEDDKLQGIGTMFRQRLAILHAGMGIDLAADESFLQHVLGVWMHMINFNGKLTKKKFADPPGTLHFENPYGPPLHDNEYFPSPLTDVLPDVLAYFRRDD